MLVVDASIILSLILEDENALLGQAAVEALDTLPAIAPDLMWYELRNALVVNERRGRHTRQQTSAFLLDVGRLPITLRRPPVEESILDLARTHGLSIYDSAYLDMALTYEAKLATLDKKLMKAAKQEGVGCWKGLLGKM